MRKKVITYVYWYSQKNANDGRRDSAIGSSKSKWHISAGNSTTICGRKVWLWETYTTDDSKVLVSDTCKACIHKEFKI